MSKPKKYKSYHTDEPPTMCTQPGYENRQLCQGCIEEGHIQLPVDEAFDCKMVFSSGEGQCCCCSKEHGIRTEDDW